MRAAGRFDVGHKLDFLRANIELALDREDLGPSWARGCATWWHGVAGPDPGGKP